MRPSSTDLELHSHLETSAPRTAAAIRALNIEIGTLFRQRLDHAHFKRLFKRQAALVLAAASEAPAIRKFSQSAD